MKTVINILEDGTAESLGSVDIPDCEVIRKVRVSTIQPAHPVKRVWFKLLRLMFGDNGRVAEYTRTFDTIWVVTIIDTNESFESRSRDECIQWECSKIHLYEITQDLPRSVRQSRETELL